MLCKAEGKEAFTIFTEFPAALRAYGLLLLSIFPHSAQRYMSISVIMLFSCVVCISFSCLVSFFRVKLSKPYLEIVIRHFLCNP